MILVSNNNSLYHFLNSVNLIYTRSYDIKIGQTYMPDKRCTSIGLKVLIEAFLFSGSCNNLETMVFELCVIVGVIRCCYYKSENLYCNISTFIHAILILMQHLPESLPES